MFLHSHTMKSVCSFCGTVIREGDSPDDRVSHGLCKTCYQRILATHGFSIKKFLNMLDAPVFLVDDDVNILEANSLALRLVKKPVSLVRGTICGVVMECINAFQPEGCGRTPACPECIIRSTVDETYRTGRAIERRPATLRRRLDDGSGDVRFLVTTRREEGIVLLRLETPVSP